MRKLMSSVVGANAKKRFVQSISGVALLMTVFATQAQANTITVDFIATTPYDSFTGQDDVINVLETLTPDPAVPGGYFFSGITSTFNGDAILGPTNFDYDGTNAIYAHPDYITYLTSPYNDLHGTTFTVAAYPGVNFNISSQNGIVAVLMNSSNDPTADYSITLPLTVSVTVVPETSTWIMMLLGFAGLGFAGSRRANKNMSALA